MSQLRHDRSLNDIFNIIVATDVHLGFNERDPIRGEDSFRAFEEVLRLAQTNKVDMVLLAGDLFHEARPSNYCIYKCTDLLRKYCMGDKPVEFEMLSDAGQSLNRPVVNYEDPNLNISIPVFSIHGNHDDPVDGKNVSALDTVSSMGLVNYVGRNINFKEITLNPVLLRKGRTKIAIYGLSHVKDDRLVRMLQDQKVTFTTVHGSTDDYFNVLLLHQNRAHRGSVSFVPESALPSFLDLVLWGHEHDAHTETQATSHGVYIWQPGSTIATSLSKGEALPKHAGLLKICAKEFDLTPIPLRQVRPFIFREYNLKCGSNTNIAFDGGAGPTVISDSDSDDDDAAVTDDGRGGKRTVSSRSAVRKKSLTPSEWADRKLSKHIAQMLTEAKTLGCDQDLLPLLRLVVYYTNEKYLFNAIRYGQKYMGVVANPDDMLMFKKRTVISAKDRGRKNKVKGGSDDEADSGSDSEHQIESVEELIVKMLDDRNINLELLSIHALNEAVRRYVQVDDTSAMNRITSHEVTVVKDKLEELSPDLDQIRAIIDQIGLERRNLDRVTIDNELSQLPLTSGANTMMSLLDDSDDDVQMTWTTTSAKPTRGRGSRGGRTTTAGTKRGRGRGAATNNKTDTSTNKTTKLALTFLS